MMILRFHPLPTAIVAAAVLACVIVGLVFFPHVLVPGSAGYRSNYAVGQQEQQQQQDGHSRGQVLSQGAVDNEPARWIHARDIPDTRHPACKRQTHPQDLPSISIVICYRNESAILLARTLHSIFRRTPENLLDKIILVDDNGDLDALDPYTQNGKDMQAMLQEMQQFPKVQVIHNEKTEGLIRSRTIGADHVVGSPVIVFLDSHIEVNTNWLEPMLQRIKEDPTRVIVPIIDLIDDTTFEYSGGNALLRGGFSELLDYQWIPLASWQTPSNTEGEILPRTTPAMPGGLFAIDRLWWEKIGKYDLGMDVWGGENIEMSLRIWQCGGSIEFAPCSHIGHMFRTHYQKFKDNFPYLFPKGTSMTVTRNKARCAEVWMDSSKARVFKRLFGNENMPPNFELGDVSSRVELRQKLQCKSFDWYLEKIYPEWLNS